MYRLKLGFIFNKISKNHKCVAAKCQQNYLSTESIKFDEVNEMFFFCVLNEKNCKIFRAMEIGKMPNLLILFRDQEC